MRLNNLLFKEKLFDILISSGDILNEVKHNLYILFIILY